MANNFIRDGKTIPYANSGAVTSGQGVAIGGTVGIAHEDYAAGETGEYHTEGVFNVTKAGAQTWAAGDDVNMTSAGVFTTAAAGGGGVTDAGVAWVDAGSSDTTGQVKINAVSGSAA